MHWVILKCTESCAKGSQSKMFKFKIISINLFLRTCLISFFGIWMNSQEIGRAIDFSIDLKSLLITSNSITNIKKFHKGQNGVQRLTKFLNPSFLLTIGGIHLKYPFLVSDHKDGKIVHYSEKRRMGEESQVKIRSSPPKRNGPAGKPYVNQLSTSKNI